MTELPDPRCFAATTANPITSLSERAVNPADALQRRAILDELHAELRGALGAGRDDLLTPALAEVVSPAAGRVLWEALDRAINSPGDPHNGLAAQVFAFPLVLVTGGPASVTVPGTLREPHAIEEVLATEGALGHVRNFGLNGALCADTSMEGFSPSQLYAVLRGLESGGTQSWSDLLPAEIDLDSADESVHLRFLTGVAVTPAQAPSIVETAADIGRWGMPVSRELIAQLGQPGLSLLALPRPPNGLLQAVHAGRRAREEIAYQVFLSSALRRMRAETGEPEATVAALEGGAIGVRLLAPADGQRRAFHRWELDALDDLTSVTESILGLLAECRVRDVRILPAVVSESDFSAGESNVAARYAGPA